MIDNNLCIITKLCLDTELGVLHGAIEWFSNNCRKTKTTVIILTNHSRQKQCNQLIRSKHMNQRQARENGCEQFWFGFSLVSRPSPPLTGERKVRARTWEQVCVAPNRVRGKETPEY